MIFRVGYSFTDFTGEPSVNRKKKKFSDYVSCRGNWCNDNERRECRRSGKAVLFAVQSIGGCSRENGEKMTKHTHTRAHAYAHAHARI